MLNNIIINIKFYLNSKQISGINFFLVMPYFTGQDKPCINRPIVGYSFVCFFRIFLNNIIIYLSTYCNYFVSSFFIVMIIDNSVPICLDVKTVPPNSVYEIVRLRLA